MGIVIYFCSWGSISAESLSWPPHIQLFLVHAYTLHECTTLKASCEHRRWHIQDKAEAAAQTAAVRSQHSWLPQLWAGSRDDSSTYTYLPQKTLNQKTLLKCIPRTPQCDSISLLKPQNLVLNGWVPNKMVAAISKARWDAAHLFSAAVMLLSAQE